MSSDVEFVEDGDQFFEQLWEMIDSSKTCCWILTYHMVDNFIATETLKRLMRAAERGVSVVLFVDWLNFWVNMDLVQELRYKGGVVVALNPMSFFMRYAARQRIFSKEIFERYHQKLFLIDEQVIIGTANLDCAYAGTKHGTGNFYDLNLLIKGKLIAEAQSIFHNIAARYKIPLKVPKLPETPAPNLEMLLAEPNYMRFDIQEKALAMLANAKDRILLIQGYYFYIPKVIKALRDAVDRGVQVELYTSRSRDQPCYVHMPNSWLTKEARAAGVKVYEYPQSVLHMKAYIVDDHFLIGSFNNDKWSWGMNNELDIYNSDPALTRELVSKVELVRRRSLEVKDEELTWKQWFLIYVWWAFLETSERVMDRRKWMKENFQEAYIQAPGESTESRFLRKRKAYKRRLQEAKSFISLGLLG
jgi:cardiolipin synthase